MELPAKRRAEEFISFGASESSALNVDLAALRVAIVHDFLYCYAGAERVLAEMLEVVPHADIFSLFDFIPAEDRGFLRGKKVRTSFLQNLPLMRTKHRNFLPLMPLAIENLDLSAYDLVLSSSYLSAKGVITAPHQLHICYCHSPARFAWDQQHQYLEQCNMQRGVRGMIARLVLHYIRGWDVKSANRVDVFLANSQFVRQRIEKTYRRDATPIYPPVDVQRFTLQEKKLDYYVTVSRLVPYKRADLIVEAFGRMPEKKLVVIGDGPELGKLQRLARPNVRVLGSQPHAVMLEHMQKARAFVFAAEEDFGIAPVEAQACGTPVIAFGRGGVTESVIAGKTGLFFARQTVEDLIAAVRKFEQYEWNPELIRKNAENFSREVFRRNFRHEVETGWARFQHRRGQLAGESSRMRETGVHAAGLRREARAVIG